MINSGNYRHYIEILEKQETDKIDDNGYKITEYVSVAKIFANIESRIGGLLAGRPADTVMTSVTHKVTYPYYNFPVIVPDKHIIKYDGHTFDVNYSIDENFEHQELQVFVTEKI